MLNQLVPVEENLIRNKNPYSSEALVKHILFTSTVWTGKLGGGT